MKNIIKVLSWIKKKYAKRLGIIDHRQNMVHRVDRMSSLLIQQCQV